VTVERSGEWLRLLEAERARRTARAQWAAGEDERARDEFTARLQGMAARFAAVAHLQPLRIDDMSPAEMLARHLLPPEAQPPGLASEDEIWRQYRARAAGRGGEP